MKARRGLGILPHLVGIVSHLCTRKWGYGLEGSISLLTEGTLTTVGDVEEAILILVLGINVGHGNR